VKILLVGNPNVGKSLVFSQLTGLNVTASNYPGTTVEFYRGYMGKGEDRHEIIDVPGMYSMEPTCEAEQVARKMLNYGDVIINVLDATNLERNLNLTLQLAACRKPMVVALNFWDEAKQKGIGINTGKLESILGVPVIPVSAVTGEGLKTMVDRLKEARVPPFLIDKADERWEKIGTVIREVQTLRHRHPTLLEHLQNMSFHPVYGFLTGVAVLLVSIFLIIFIGEFLIGIIELLLTRWYLPLIEKLSPLLGGEGLFHDVLIGKLIDGTINLEESLGLLTTGVYVAFGVVLPYISIFYFILGFWEDFGYLPRLAVLMDRIMHRIGLHGFAVVPLILAFGCNVPGVLALRNLESRREKFIAATIMAIGIPCMAQSSIIIGLVGKHGLSYLLLVFAFLFFIWTVLGIFGNCFIQGHTPSLLMEIPPYRLPRASVQLKKLKMRVTAFLTEAIPFVFGSILLVDLLHALGVINWIARLIAPVISGLWGLPETVTSTLMIGFLRKDVAVALLEALTLTPAQLTITALILTLYFPCAATFAVIMRELGLKDTLKAIGIMLTVTLLSGTFLSLTLDRLLPPQALVVLLVAASIVLAVLAAKKNDPEDFEDFPGT
jgi:ferrous iron transport protein B